MVKKLAWRGFVTVDGIEAAKALSLAKIKSGRDLKIPNQFKSMAFVKCYGL